jgi:nicotinamidase/pyrazinamidase
MRAAVLIVDIQNDFCVGGALPARDTETLIEPVNAFVARCAIKGIHLVFTRDWHPANHSSFVNCGGPWPTHCVQGTDGAAFVPTLRVPANAEIVDKGFLADSVGYSDFENTVLHRTLQAWRVVDIAVCGIATEYCVLANVEDALARGYVVTVLGDLIRHIEAETGDGEIALQKMRKGGARLRTSSEWWDYV